jgi:hypothetical protein
MSAICLPENAIVYRAILRKQWIDEDTGRVKADAYFLRANEYRLSVNLASVYSPERCAGGIYAVLRMPAQ